MPSLDPSRLIDISVQVGPGTPRWPGSPPFRAETWMSLVRGDVATDTVITHSVHLGTHIDAPAHFVPGGATVDAIPLDVLVGPCQVVEVSGGGAIGPERLEEVLPKRGATRILLRTENSGLWKSEGDRFFPDFTALSPAGAAWLVERGVRLVGIDYLSIQRYDDPPDTHLHLLRAGVVILEGLDLGQAPAGHYDLVCLPQRLVGLEAAPARALLLKHE